MKKSNKPFLTCIPELGIYNPAQALLYLPREYRARIEPLQDFAITEEIAAFSCYLRGRAQIKPGSKPPQAKVTLVSPKGTPLFANIIGNIWEWKNIKPGSALTIKGKIQPWNNYLTMLNPVILTDRAINSITPVYPKESEHLLSLISAGLNNDLTEATDMIRKTMQMSTDQEIFQQAGIENFPSLASLLVALHEPATEQQGIDALAACQKLICLEILERAKQSAKRPEMQGSRISIDTSVVASLVSQLPYATTEDQNIAITETIRDLQKPYAMRRLLSGDVGTGKSTVIGVTAAAVNQSHSKAAILVPNVLLAKQLAGEFQQWWPDIPILLVLDDRKFDPQSLDCNPIVIGTTAIFSRLIKANWFPDYLVCDEQHKLARKQREKLLLEHANLLESTATCIPRTAALVQYGDMSVSTLQECPVRKTIESFIILNAQKDRMIARLRLIIAQGGQAAIVYPRVDVDEQDEHSLLNAAEEWNRHFPGQVRILHGKMDDAEKEFVINEMKQGKFQILLSSTVIEVGITIPNLAALVVVRPEKFGIAQLHQLRGRVARKGGRGWFFMFLAEPKGLGPMKRLMLLVNHADGFSLAEQDMQLRGFGEVGDLGDKQKGHATSHCFIGSKTTPQQMTAFTESSG